MEGKAETVWTVQPVEVKVQEKMVSMHKYLMGARGE